MYCLKFILEENKTPRGDLQVKEILETSTGSELKDWQFPLYDILLNNPKEAAAIKRKSPRFYYNAITRTLYRLSYDQILLLCLSHKEAHEALKEAHDGTCGAHQLGPNWETDSEDLATTDRR